MHYHQYELDLCNGRKTILKPRKEGVGFRVLDQRGKGVIATREEMEAIKEYVLFLVEYEERGNDYGESLSLGMTPEQWTKSGLENKLKSFCMVLPEGWHKMKIDEFSKFMHEYLDHDFGPVRS